MTENVHSLLGAYAVDAVTPAERAEFEAHLPGCEECALELASLGDTTAILADAEAVAPPATLRARVMDEISRTAQLPPVVDHAVEGRPVDQDVSRDDAPVPLASRRRRVWPRLAVAAAAAAVLAVGGIVGTNLMEQREQQLALEKDVMMVATAPDAHAMDLGLGSAHLVMSERMGSVVAMGDDCPEPKDGMEYQIWVVMDDGSKKAGPTFMPDGDGTFMALLEMEMDGVAAFAVTEEPSGGSEQPTSEAVAEVAL